MLQTGFQEAQAALHLKSVQSLAKQHSHALWQEELLFKCSQEYHNEVIIPLTTIEMFIFSSNSSYLSNLHVVQYHSNYILTLGELSFPTMKLFFKNK